MSQYTDLEACPEGQRVELHDGRLDFLPQPKARHQIAGSRLNRRIGGPFDDGIGGPGGWWIIAEPEVHLILDTEVYVPDLAGWKRERMPVLPDGHKFTVIPDWIAEILSPGTAGRDRGHKLQQYAAHGVPWVWLIDPHNETVEIFDNADGQPRFVGAYDADQEVNAPPFLEVRFQVADLFR